MTNPSAPAASEAIRRVAWVYRSPQLFGAGRIIRDYLGMAPQDPLPVSIPHGVDTYMNGFDLDLELREPLYLALRPDIASRAARQKPVLPFPHPWLLMRAAEPRPAGTGTLFIAPPPCPDTFEQMFAAITGGSFPKPWGILLKQRGMEASDWEWWTTRSVVTHCAGGMDDENFYYNLRDIIGRYACVASPNLSSAVIFAAEMGRRVFPLPDIDLSVAEVADAAFSQDLDDASGRIRATWSALFSPDAETARRQALDLLGARYLDAPAALRRRLEEAVASLDRAVHLHPLRPGRLHAIIQRLIGFGLPLHKLFPHPLRRVKTFAQRLLGTERLAILRGSDVTHYGIAPGSSRYEVVPVSRRDVGLGVKPGYAIRGAAAFREGKNVSAELRNLTDTAVNTPEIIEVAYELQAGTYVSFAADNGAHVQAYSKQLASLLEPHLNDGDVILDVGTGELTTLSHLISHLSTPLGAILACDISESRLAIGRGYASEHMPPEAFAKLKTFKAEFANLPLADRSVDIVMSNHALEPNHGREATILAELLRVTRRKLVLFEPCYELAGPEARQRMESHCYIRGLEAVAESLGATVEQCVPLEIVDNLLNPTAMFVIRPS